MDSLQPEGPLNAAFILDALSERLDPVADTDYMTIIEHYETDETYVFIDNNKKSRVWYKCDYICEYKDNHILIYKKYYYCKITKDLYKPMFLLRIREANIVTEHVVKRPLIFIRKFEKINYIQFYIEGTILGRINVAFVFDIENLRTKYSNAVNKLFQYIPSELVTEIAKKLGAKNSSTKYQPLDFTEEYKSKYTITSPYMSRMQLKLLYQMGAVKLGLISEQNLNINILSDEAFDCKFPEGCPYYGFTDNILRHQFGTKAKMHTFIDMVIKQLL